MKPKHGGKRKGAGRKPLPVPKKTLSVKLDPREIDRLNEICRAREVSQAGQVSDWINKASDKQQPSKERGCDGKANLGRSYAAQADKLSVKHGKRFGVYRCPHCGGTHITTKLMDAVKYPELLHITKPK